MEGAGSGSRSRSQSQSQSSRGSEAEEPVRSRWSPKPEQIMMLESIFNSGMVNPSKDETVRIRKVLQKFGPVGDANVFYWFQNRRSRSRRLQRQIEATLTRDVNTTTAVAVDNFVPNMSPITVGPSPTASDILLSFSAGPDTSNSHSAAAAAGGGGLITVFINGVATEVAGGRLNIKRMFGGDYGLVHSSGVQLEVNHHGFVMHNLHHGESYFLVPRNS